MSHSAIMDWSDEQVNAHPFDHCPVCEASVTPATYDPLVKVCTNGDCGKSYHVYAPLRFQPHRHNAADAVAMTLNDSGLSWPAVSVVMRVYHNIELGGDAWRHRVRAQYRRRQDP